jgi:membrane-bound lytic murein transglycosylase B
VLALAVLAPTGVAGAQEGDGTAAPDPRIDPDLWSLPTDGTEVRAAAVAQDRTARELAASRERIAASMTELASLVAAEQRLGERLVEAERRMAKSARRVDELRTSLRSLVVADYVRGGSGSSLDPSLDLGDLSGAGSRRVLVTASLDRQLGELTAHRLALVDADALATATRAEIDEVDRRIAATTAARDAAQADEARLVLQLEEDTRALADARVTAPVSGTDLTLVVLDAYVKAARATAVDDPGCALHWSLLAGIGRTESRHGTYGGTEVGPDGRTLEPILGIPLDGTRSATIADTDGGALDDDPVWDRAVGPMQFIPSTWATAGRDGDGDGEADPHNMYDTALAAAGYLCRASGELDAEPGARVALMSYNRSTEYGDVVLERAAGYRSLGLLPGDRP